MSKVFRNGSCVEAETIGIKTNTPLSFLFMKDVRLLTLR